MTHHDSFTRDLKNRTNKTYSGYDWTYDGLFAYPRVKGKDKHRRAKYERTLRKRADQQASRLCAN